MRNKSLGEFLTKKRTLQNMSSRQLAIKCNISATYMGDIEKDKRIPTFEIMKKIGNNLKLTENEMYNMFDLAAKNSTNKVPYDIVDYIMKNDNLRKCIREKIKNNDNSGWEKALENNREGFYEKI